MMLEDRYLVWRLRRGDPQALCRIYNRYETDLLTLARSLLGRTGLAEDVLQDVFVKFIEPLRSGMAGATACPATMGDLFHGFVFYQDQSLRADGILILDETGLPSDPPMPPDYKGAVAGELPYWGGEASIEITRTWFQEQFGVTFTEETRPTTIYVVRRHP